MKIIYVYDDFIFDSPILMGTLYVDRIRGVESYSFEYDDDWLDKTNITFSLDPELLPYRGRQYSNKGMFGIFKDASPDRWGRVMMRKRERLIANEEKRKPRTLYDSDFLIGVDDNTRMGGIRFKLDTDGPFIAYDDISVPPVASLRSLEEASRNYENDEGQDRRWIDELIRPGSSLGGSRPKATVIDPDGNYWIAKFPSKNDEYDVGAWEMIAYDLARLCDLDVPESRLERFSKYGSTFLSKRFDRDKGRRIHFASSMTLLDKTDGSSYQDGTSYLDIASFIKANGSRPKDDLKELYKRIIFNMAISNTDDHLRNHAFIFTLDGWKLSPLYDINPIPYGNGLALSIDGYSNDIDINLAISVARYFDLDDDQAQDIANKIIKTVNDNWYDLALKYSIKREEIELLRPAFIVF